jgi:hypothetical protein
MSAAGLIAAVRSTDAGSLVSAITGREQMQQTRCGNGDYSITSSAMASSLSGTLRPSVFARLGTFLGSFLLARVTPRR